MKYWCFFLTFCWFLSARAQRSDLIHYDVSDGLAGSTVHAFYQDQEGFMWIGTENGVSRFDGTSFKNFTTRDGLVDNEVFRIFGDSKGRIWFISYNAELCYYYKGKIYNSSADKLLRGLVVKNIAIELVEDTDKDLWFIGANTLRIGDKQSMVYKNATSITYVAHKNRIPLLFDRKGDVYELKDKVIKPRKGFPKMDPHGGGLIRQDHLFSYKDKVILVYRFTADTIFLIKQYPVKDQVMDISIDKYKNLWISTMGGGALCFGNIVKGNVSSTYLAGEFVNKVYHDKEGNTWFSAIGDGIYLLTSRNSVTYSTANGLSSNKFYAVTEDAKGRIWAGLQNGSIACIADNKVQEFILLAKHGMYNRVRYLVPAKDHSLFCGTDYGLIHIRPDHTIGRIGEQSSVKSLALRADGSMIVGYRHKTYLLKDDPLQFYNLWEKSSTALCEDHTGTIWMGTPHGLYVYGRDGIHFYGRKNSFLSRRINAVKQTKDKSIWVATNDNGVIVIQNGRIRQIAEKEGLSSNQCKSLFIDENQDIWVCTNLGLNKIVVQEKKTFGYNIEKYTRADGLPSDDVNDVYVTSDKVWVATYKGLASLKREEMFKKVPSNVYITRFQVLNDTAAVTELQALGYNQNNISIGFSGISFQSLGRMYYKYTLEGIDESWQYSHLNAIEYRNLPPGNYRFVVYARNSKNVWSLKPAVVYFTIRPAFWQTSGFKGLAALGLLAGTGSFFWLRFRLLRRKEEKKTLMNKKIAELEMEAVRAQINPHFIFNCLNSIQYYIVEHDHQSAQRYLTSFATLIRHTLDYSRHSSIKLSDEINYLENYLGLEKMRFEDKFDYEISLEAGIEKDKVEIPSMLLQPYVENAIRHAFEKEDEKGMLYISFYLSGDILMCKIDDNGIGRSFNGKAGKAIPGLHGMEISRTRMEAFNTIYQKKISLQIIDKNEAGSSGTTVLISIPS